MRILLIASHPVETSYNAAIRQTAQAALEAAGHEVDLCDLYAEGFDPVLSRADRLTYHDVECNQARVGGYVERLRAAEGLVFSFPVWTFGPPAILKGFLDRVFLPGVTFTLDPDGSFHGGQLAVRKLAAITTYGQTRLGAWLVGDPPRRLVTRIIRGQLQPGARVSYLAHYHMNAATEPGCARFLAKVERAMARF